MLNEVTMAFYTKSKPVCLDLLSGFNPYSGMKSCDYIPSFGLDYWLNLETYKIEGLESESLDLVYCRNGLHHLQDLELIAKEIKRVLKPTGTVYIIEPTAQSYSANLFLDRLWYRNINKMDKVWFSEVYRDYKKIFTDSGFETISQIIKDDKEYVTLRRN